MNKPVGFIGLGNMGAGMAANLLSAGFGVLAFDTDKERLAPFEAQQVSSKQEIAQKCDAVIICLPNPDVSRTVIFNELLAHESKISTIIETSTLTPEIVKEFTEKVTADKAKFLSAPMVGGKNHATKGTIEFLIEGEAEVFEANHKLFEAMGSKARYMGKAPSATLAKLTFNLCRYANLAVATESYRLLKGYNANTRAIYEFMSEQSLDNFGQVWAEDMKDTMTKDTPFRPSQVPLKDLSLLIEMADSHGVDKELIEAIRSIYGSMES